MRNFIFSVLVCVLYSGPVFSQSTGKSYIECNHDSLITVLRAYEDSLASASSATVVRVDYAWRVTDVAVGGKVYKIYRCEALYDSLTVLMDAVDFARATPPVVDTDSISSVTGTAAVFHAKVTSDGGEAVTAQWFRYGTSAVSLVDSVAVAGTATPFTGSVSTLTAGTTYYVAGFARNAKGTAPGDTLSFTTWAAPTVDTQAASSVTATAATLNATFTNGGAAVTATGFKYATNAALTGATSVAGSGTSSPFTGSLTGLTHATQYWAVGYATNSVGTSYGDTITFTTLAIAPTVDTDAASSVTATAATLNATITATGGNAVTATGFKYATNALLTSPTDVVGSGTSSPFTGSLTGLTASTQYWAVGYATNAVGTSYGDTITFTTSALAPTVDTDAATSVTATAATLNATITATGGSAVTATGFKYATNAALTTPTDVVGSGTTSPFTAALTGLTASTQYWAVGYATNAVGTSYGDTITFTTSAAAPSAFTCGTSTVSYDGHNYTTVLVGSQCWLKENLRNDNYNDGTAIPGNMDNATWSATTSGAQTVFGEGTSAVYAGSSDEVANLATYGRMYNWYAVNTGKLCPSGWHVPTYAEWTTLLTALGGSSVAGTKLKVSSSNTPAWDGDNTSGFSALPGGFRDYADGDFYSQGYYGAWWSSTPFGMTPWSSDLYSGSSGVGRTSYYKSYGLSVRCVQNTVAPTVDTQAASSVTATSATLNATFTDGGSAVTATGFKYATNAALTTPTDAVGSGTTSPFTAALTGLTASTQYWAVGYATNSVGTSYGDTITFTTSAAAPSASCSVPSVTYDGFTYTTVLIGSQCWFVENLRNDNYNDGSPIPGNLDDATWAATTLGAQAVYAEGSSPVGSGSTDEIVNLATYGRLYNWYAVNTGNLCPLGWHVPTDLEWTALETALGASAGDQLKNRPSDTPAWDGTNSSGFSALPGGARADLYFDQLETDGGWWSSTPDGVAGWYRYLTTGSSAIGRNGNYELGISVRCLQDAPPASSPTVDTQAESSLTATSATLNATFTDGGSAVTATGFKYATNAALTSATDVAGSGTTSPFTASLTGLTASTQYWAVGYATNAVGTSYGDTITFTTSAAAAFTCGTSTVTYDGHNYTTVQIGSQCWFKENLRNDDYNDATPIPGNLDNTAWTNTTSGAQAVYDQGGANEITNLATYGRLYNWYAVNTGKLCPVGWHVPTDAEWTTLETALGGASVAGTKMKVSASNTPAWDGDNTSGFSALPGGYRNIGNGTFANQGSNGSWWSSSTLGPFNWYRYLGSGASNLTQYYNGSRSGYSVRCLQD
jgi:uncharacterized protein (TIGR02145 family)